MRDYDGSSPGDVFTTAIKTFEAVEAIFGLYEMYGGKETDDPIGVLPATIPDGVRGGTVSPSTRLLALVALQNSRYVTFNRALAGARARSPDAVGAIEALLEVSDGKMQYYENQVQLYRETARQINLWRAILDVARAPGV